MSAGVSSHRIPEGKYDAAARRRSRRTARERGCWVYIPAVELQAAGVNPYAKQPPAYRVWGRRGGSVLVRLYREP